MLKINGLDRLSKNLEDAQKAIAEIDGELGSVNFDPQDPESIEAAIQETARLLDERLGSYASNPIVGQLAENIKGQYRQAILDKATTARIQTGQADGE